MLAGCTFCHYTTNLENSLDFWKNCGKVFSRSRFNSYINTCPDCRKAEKQKDAPKGRTLICKQCNAEFEISKFQPYLTPDFCPKCRKANAHKAYIERKKS